MRPDIAVVESFSEVWQAGVVAEDSAPHQAEHPLREPELSREERQFLIGLRRVMHRTIDSSPADFGFDRLQRDLDAIERDGRRQGRFARLERWLMRISGL